APHTIPMLALNQLEEDNFYNRNFYQFPLSPEDEAKQVANRAWLDGHNRAAVITPDNKWGERLAEAFKTEWEKLGGVVATESQYNARKNDFSKPIKSLLAIDESEQRRREISRLLRTKVRFEPRRRQDIDVIFMAALPRQARLIPPQLEFYHAESLPIYTTSHSYTGRMNRKNDRDLNGIMIADMPWTLNSAYMETLKKQVYRNWPNKSKQFNRLYALGTDAYNILFYLNWLRDNSNAQLQGATGILHMNEKNQVIRQLSWAKFRNGLPRLIAATTAPVK
ncbi:MAG: penicillin-binding protein activator, partial [Gammaproteobacteria bacterium]|nr:penicillin-binding protein activator [Gammaproteobacteria bacterium]